MDARQRGSMQPIVEKIEGITFVDYKDESQLNHVMSLVGRDLSEPYSGTLDHSHCQGSSLTELRSKVFTYRYFLSRYPKLCILAVDSISEEPIGCVVGKIDEEEGLDGIDEVVTNVGYIGMLAVSEKFRRRGIGKALVHMILHKMKSMGCTSATLETEVQNLKAQRLYQESFGFVREELLVRYYLNWNDAYRLRLWFD